MPDEYGPFDTERQARAAAHAVVPPEPGWSILRAPQCRRLFEIACETAGIEPGAYGQRILDWLAGFEDSACSVVADLVVRAHLAGKAWAFTEADVKPCRHCGGPLIPCRPGHDLPVCKGWKHAAWLSMGPIGPHYCEGRSVNPSGEPKEEVPE